MRGRMAPHLFVDSARERRMVSTVTFPTNKYPCFYAGQSLARVRNPVFSNTLQTLTEGTSNLLIVLFCRVL
jgi:hypothetical protein